MIHKYENISLYTERATGIDIHYIITRFGWVLCTIIANVQLMCVCVCACMVNNWMQKNPPTIRILNKNPLYVWLGFARARECSAFLSRSFIVSVSWLVSQMTKCLTNYHRASNFCTNTQTRGHKSQSKGRIFIFDNTIIIVIRNANMARAFPLCPQCIYLRR